MLVDTSAFLAVLNADDENHESAKRLWTELNNQQINLVCNNYVLVETFALAQHRLGMPAVRALQEDVVPVLQIEWVDESAHHAAVTAMLTAARRKLSLVDCASFETMRRMGLKTAFTFDHHFREQGFTCLP
ncbi:MAG: PIN domain-containing protein [Chloroflexi bacterium]|nr:PIN domain-containing protein [Chloroflexota bacterium]